MSDDRARELHRLNALVSALDRAGVSVDAEGNSGVPCRQIDAVDRAMKAGVAPEAALQEHAADTSYAELASGWLAGCDPADLLESYRRTALHLEVRRRRLGWRLAYPMLVAVLACVGLAWMNSSILPLVEAAHADLKRPVGAGVSWLQAVRFTTPFWLIGLPLALLLACGMTSRLRPMQLTRGSREFSSRSRRRLGCRCDRTAALFDAGIECESAIGPLATAPGPPPLIAWAREAAPTGDAGAEDFRAIGNLYETLARLGSERSTRLLPIIACVVVGGGATLIYALALFVPVAELLWTIAE